MEMRPFDLNFLCWCVTSGSSCTRCICPQNQINEITSVPERLLMVIDQSAEEEEEEEEEAAGGILMQDKCQTGFLLISNMNTSSGRHLLTLMTAGISVKLFLISDHSVLHGSKLTSDLKETEISAVLSASTVLQPADDSRFTSYIRPNESTGTLQREWCGQHGRAEVEDKRCTDLSVIFQDRAACWQRCGGSYVTAENPGFKSIPVTPYYCYYCYYGMSISRSVT